jgi:hypothetical protein
MHPQDPITIYMERFPGRHVQVFTGYLDTTPYLQLIPGPVTIEATCTLKRLEMNYFQLAQQYTLSFFEHFGWKITGEGEVGGIIPVNQGPFANSAFQEEAKKKWAEEIKAVTCGRRKNLARTGEKGSQCPRSDSRSQHT